MRTYFTGSTTKDAVGYRCGEVMRFELTMKNESGCRVTCPYFLWEASGDDGQKNSGKVSGEEGTIALEFTMTKPGFLHLKVTPLDENEKPIEGYEIFEGGAGAEIEKLEQGADDPGDFDEFWAEQLKLLDEYPSVPLSMVRRPESDEQFDVFDVQLPAPGPKPVSGYLSIPKGAVPGSCRAEIRFHGYGVCSSCIYKIPGAVTLDVNIHGVENGHPQEYYDELRAKELAGFGFNKEENESPYNCYFRFVILRDLLGARFLKTLPEYDGKGIHAAGGSMGAMQSVLVAAHDSDVVSLMINVPWMCDLGGIEKGRMGGWRPDLQKGVLYYDTAINAKRVKCPVKITCGLGDYVCPPSTEVILWKNFKTAKSIEFLQNKTHPYNPPEVISYRR